MGDTLESTDDGALEARPGQTIRFNGPQLDGSFDVTYTKDGQLLVEFHGVNQLAVLPLAGNRFVFEANWKAVRDR